jgi:hypothetical protein
MKIMAPISLGELIDKITILEIKFERVKDTEKRHNIRVELDELNLIYLPLKDRHLDNFHLELKEINERIWELEDIIRNCIKTSDNGDLYYTAALNIPLTNDRRAEIKKQINEQFGSEIIEEKLYV